MPQRFGLIVSVQGLGFRVYSMCFGLIIYYGTLKYLYVNVYELWYIVGATALWPYNML